MAGTRDYSVGKAPSFAASTPSPHYLPGFGSLGPMFGAMRDPVLKGGPKKRLFAQDLGTVVGRRGAGISQITGGDEGLHSVGQYGKTNPVPHLVGGGGGGDDTTGSGGGF